MNSTEVLHGKI